MAQIQPSGPTWSGSPNRSGRKAVRYGVPIAVAGIAAATIGLVPALADTGDPDLPKITAEELIAKIAESDVDQLSGTVKVNTDLGLPALPGSSGGGDRGGPFGGDRGDKGEQGEDGEDGEKDEKSAAAPEKKLMQLASGEHTLRVAADGPDKQRLSIVEDAAEYSVIHNGQDVWTYDSASNSAVHLKAPKGAGQGEHKGADKKLPSDLADLTPQEAAEQALKAVGKTTDVSVDGTAKVAGRDAYQLVIKPKGAADSTVESIRIAVDGDNGTPLKLTLSPKGGGKPVVDIGYTKVDFGKPAASSFEFKAPKGTEVTEQKLDGKAAEKARGKADKDWGKGGKRGGASDLSDLSGLQVLGKGWNTVAEIELPDGALTGPGGPDGGEAKKGLDSSMAKNLLDGLTEEVNGEFGTGRVFETKLVNVLITDDGKIYAGAVTKDGLVKAADRAAK